MQSIAVLLASRGRPVRLSIALTRIFQTATRPERIKVAVWLDDDDPTVNMAGLSHWPNVRVVIGKRPRALGDVHDYMSNLVDADLYTVLADDVYPVENGWDEELIRNHEHYRRPVYCWVHRNSSDPAYPILTREWVKAAGGIFTSGLFPFWFDDFWLAEVAELVMGEPVYMIDGLKLTGDKMTGTPRMRDLPFWYRVFHRTRPMRIAEAEAIHAKIFDRPLRAELERADLLADFAEGDARREASAVGWEEKYSTATGEPDAGYVAAKQYAESLLARL